MMVFSGLIGKLRGARLIVTGFVLNVNNSKYLEGGETMILGLTVTILVRANVVQ